MEGWIGLLKQYQRKHGNMRDGWMIRCIEYLDLYCIGAVYQNQIDFAAIEANHHFRKTLVYENGITKTLEMNIESQLPELCIDILEDLDTMEFGDALPESIDNRINGLRKEHAERLKLLRNAYLALSEEERRHQGVDLDLFTQEQAAIDKITGRRVRRSRANWFIQEQKLFNQIQSIPSDIPNEILQQDDSTGEDSHSDDSFSNINNNDDNSSDSDHNNQSVVITNVNDVDLDSDNTYYELIL